MISNGVEFLKYQFSKAIDQTFEQFLDSWTLPPVQEEPGLRAFETRESPAGIPVIPSM
jgi:hypothetical protein